MKEIKLGARLSAYSKIEAVTHSSSDHEEMTTCDVDKLFGESCEKCQTIVSRPNEVTTADIDALFR